MEKPQILVVEDDPIVAKDIQLTLQRLGYRAPVVVGGGADAIRMAGENRPDLVFIDIALRGPMDGIATANAIREQFGIPVVYLMDNTDAGTLERAKASEPLAYIATPFDDRGVHLTLEMAFHKHEIRKKLKESEHWLSITLQSITDGLIATDAAGAVRLMNEVAASLTGWKPEDAKGKPLTAVLRLQSERSGVFEEVSKVLEQQISSKLTGLLLAHKEGALLPIELSLGPIRGTHGDMQGAVLVFRDVSKQKDDERRLYVQYAVSKILAEEVALDEAEPRILQVFGVSLGWDFGAFWLVDAVEGKLDCTATWRRPDLDLNALEAASRKLQPRQGEGLVGRVWVGEPLWLVDALRDLSFRRRAAAAANDLHGYFAVPIRLGKETLGVIEFLSRTPRERDPQLIRTLTTLGNQIAQFVQRRQAEAALRHSEARYRGVVEGSIQGIAIHQDGMIQYANPAYTRIFGFAVPSDIIGMQSEALIAHEEIAGMRGRMATILRGDLVGPHEDWQGVRKTGECIWLESTGGLITWRDRPAVLQFIIEITARKRLEEQLRQAQKMEAIGHLAGGVAHDFNNLITVINGFSEVLLGTVPAGDPARQPLREIRKAGDRAAALTRQLLAFSRKQILNPAALDSNTVVADMEKMLRRLIGEDIRLVKALDGQTGAIKADPGQLEQALLNLVVNSRDAMPTGGVLTIATRNVDLSEQFHPDVKPGSYVMFAVSDTGTGIDEPTKARIFEPFFTTKDPGKGTGLGLAMVYGFIKQSGGHIDVDSEKGRGTTIRFYLPRIAGSAPSGGSHPELNVPRGTETVLLVEDEDSVRALAKLALETNGYEVLEAENGEEALRLVAEYAGRIDIVVTDVVMPQLGGRQLVDRLQAFRPHLRVLYLSGYTDDTVLRHGVVDRLVAFLAKPFTPSALAGKVREVLDFRDVVPLTQPTPP